MFATLIALQSCCILINSAADSTEPDIKPTRAYTQEPHNRLTCYYCENVQNNYICNKYAIDTPCPIDTTFCRTLHIMDRGGNSLVVDKRCVSPDVCTQDRVGCLQEDHQRTCMACCDASYCNIGAPTNYSNALLSLSPTAPTRAMTSTASDLQNPLVIFIAFIYWKIVH